MKELVGICNRCGIEIYCENGFLDGHHDGGELLCKLCVLKGNKAKHMSAVSF
ncbi:hypothetical protein KGF86_08395 [Ornithinibacillus massiliensis]|uniref:GapA-binding peptide SR1P n=1 Tax=Ornithinibacillus massiliensis TaxID=1944633 RepID=A0ABS5MD40_9BACI|nr:hypothetical protein [Ornithinibacillus massiliensis]